MMKISPVKEIHYDENKPALIITATSNETHQALLTEFKRVSYEGVRDRNASHNIEVIALDGNNIRLSGNLNVAVEHLACRKYLELSKLTELRAQLVWAKYGASLLMEDTLKPSAQEARPKSKSIKINENEDSVIIHT